MTETHDNHIVKLPLWVWILKIVQGVLAVIILGLAAYGVHWFSLDAWSLALFTTIFTGLSLLYYFLSTTVLKVGYSWIPVIVLESLLVVFWLTTFAMLADLVGKGKGYFGGGYGYNWGDFNFLRRDVHSFAKRDDTYDPDTYYAVVCAGMVFSLFNWIFFIITLVMLSLNVHRHRLAGGPMYYGGAATTVGTTNRGDAEAAGAEKYEVQNIPPPASTAPPPSTVPDSTYYQQPQQHDASQQHGAPSPYPAPAQPAPYQQSVSPPPPNTYEAPN
jgi:hypothetical protein